jgi:transcriptional regulator with XRE-family HTH domain
VRELRAGADGRRLIGHATYLESSLLNTWLICSLGQHPVRNDNVRMHQLAANTEFRSFRRMPIKPVNDDLQIGRAFKALREQLRMTQGQIGQALSPTISSQAWQKYEAGERHFTEDKIAAALDAMNLDHADLENELQKQTGAARTPQRWEGRSGQRGLIIPIWGRARMGPRGPEVYDASAEQRSVDLVQFFGPEAGAFELAGESMTGWGETGDLVIFDRARWPGKNKPCVIETKTGELYCKFFEKEDGSTVFARETFPEPKTITFKMIDLKGVYRVRAKLES